MTNVNPVPDGYRSLNPFLAVPNGAKAIDFYTAVFGAEVLSRHDLPDGKVGHADSGSATRCCSSATRCRS